MPEAGMTALINAGILGPVLVAVGVYVLKLHKQISEAQEKRVTDAQNVAKRILEIVDKHNEVQKDLALALAQNNNAIGNLKEAVRDLAQTVGRTPP